MNYSILHNINYSANEGAEKEGDQTLSFHCQTVNSQVIKKYLWKILTIGIAKIQNKHLLSCILRLF